MANALQPTFLPVHRVGLLVFSVLLLVLVLELVRRGLLKERYALLWLATAAAGAVIGVFPKTIVKFAQAMHFQFLTVVFLLGFLFLLALVLSFSVVLSRLSERNRKLTQEVALLAQVIKKAKESNGPL